MIDEVLCIYTFAILILLSIQQTQTLERHGVGVGKMWECQRTSLLCKQRRDEGRRKADQIQTASSPPQSRRRWVPSRIAIPITSLF